MSIKYIPLSQGKYATVDESDYDWLSKWEWSAMSYGRRGNLFRAFRNDLVDGKKRVVYMHNQITGYSLTDHVNGDGLDNRRQNLREATKSQNTHNSSLPSHNTSGYKGVSHLKQTGRWRAHISVNGKDIQIGYFDSASEAAIAYDRMAYYKLGEFARLNFPRVLGGQ